MKNFKRILKSILVIILITVTFINSITSNKCATAQAVPQKQIKTAVLLFSFDDPYISLVRKGLEEIQNKNTSSVDFTFYDGKRNQDIQNALLDSVLQSDYDLLLINLVDLDQSTVESVIYKAKQKNIPIILFNTVPIETAPIKSYKKALVISTNAIQSGILQGDLVINEWNSSKNVVDKNNDNILQYIMLKGPNNITVTTARSLYSILTINQSGIKTQEILSKTCNWDEKCAEDSIRLLFLTHGKNIEAIISNNDAMAIGAINALQSYGYNKGDDSKYIPVFGIDGIPEATDLINRGIMSGTVLQDPNETAEALYVIGMNLANNLNPLQGTNYKFDETGVTINMPYHEYKPQKQ
ncbi:galactose ABC transporter substrate-binding protein [Clostridium beijerinckii]|uniref:D-galactose/methyl-galactoside binding periplasmic protein MglB n=1 Tax=Clostridium beijerinckii TaxID=1520 RepID=A0AAX0B4K1_CLOBE|nr:galactose ABC transporter substrate-binding protein [Clostridium beijerinckii]NRT90007.1 methyl-galactoside transport system substrate-binding protein [Clostridium beijerinckii]NYC69538.1 methyl-galactoside transport system substrate-binding protein [Clostridium beijerinckii]NYC75464.1 methyl-galactoside transport system substrate-binding protein [Clostridium beijerinckii]